MVDVRYWHSADISADRSNVSFDPIRSFRGSGANVLNREPTLAVTPNTTHANAVANGKARAGELFGIGLNAPPAPAC